MAETGQDFAKQLAIRLRKEDIKNLNIIRERYGVKAYAEAIRLAIRETVKKINDESK